MRGKCAGDLVHSPQQKQVRKVEVLDSVGEVAQRLDVHLQEKGEGGGGTGAA